MEKKYEKIESRPSGTIQDAVSKLLRYKNDGKLAYTEFNGTKLYSDNVTMDSAYKEITGKTKEELDKAERDWKKNYEEELKKHEDQIPKLTKEWVEKGKKVLSKNKWDYWEEVVPVRLGDLYRGMELRCCLDIVRILNNSGSLDEAEREMDKQSHSGMSYSLVLTMVREFSDRGQEFEDYVR